MKLSLQYSFDFDACFEDEWSGKLVGFDIEFWWKVLPIEGRHVPPELGRGSRERLIHAESNFCIEDGDELAMVGIPMRHSQGAKYSFQLGAKRDQRRFRYKSRWSGGNIFWQTYRLRLSEQPHLLNFLRRQKLYSPSEYDCEFHEGVWRRRQSLTHAHLREWARCRVMELLKHEATASGMVKVSELFPAVHTSLQLAPEIAPAGPSQPCSLVSHASAPGGQ